ncbi:MAG: hypothetical protein ACRDZX_11305, partial [Acidimicrobiales bacterium]
TLYKRRNVKGLPQEAARPIVAEVATVYQCPLRDLGPTDVEVYGPRKQGTAYNYAGQRDYRPHPAVWAAAGWAVAAELGSGRPDPRPQAPGLIARAVPALPEDLGRPIIRADPGFFAKEVAWAALANGADFAIAVKRNEAIWARGAEDPRRRLAKSQRHGRRSGRVRLRASCWPPGTRTACPRVKGESR